MNFNHCLFSHCHFCTLIQISNVCFFLIFILLFKGPIHPKIQSLTLMSFPTCKTFLFLWNTKEDIGSVFFFFVLFFLYNRVNGIQCCLGPHKLSFYGQKQFFNILSTSPINSTKTHMKYKFPTVITPLSQHLIGSSN